MELRPYQEKINKDKKEEEIKPDKSFELELWTWDEYEVPTLQHAVVISVLNIRNISMTLLPEN